MVKNVKMQMKEHFFNSSDPISINKFLATFKLSCNTSNMQIKAAAWVLPFFG